MTIKEAILKSLEDLRQLVNYSEVYNHIVENRYYSFSEGKTPEQTVSALLGDFIRKGDSRVKRIKGTGGTYTYYLSKYETEIGTEQLVQNQSTASSNGIKSSFAERDLHILLSSFLKNDSVYTRTIFHEKSLNSKDNNQKWIHPDMIGIEFLRLGSKISQSFMKSINRVDAFKLYSYELKKEITSDIDLKKCYFQAVSNSSWANYGYLVTLEINDSLLDEMARLNESFGIGLILLKPNPYESQVLFSAKYRTLDLKTIDKLCQVNIDFSQFIEQTEKLLTASERYENAVERELEEFCDPYFKSDSEMEIYISKKRISTQEA